MGGKGVKRMYLLLWEATDAYVLILFVNGYYYYYYYLEQG